MLSLLEKYSIVRMVATRFAFPAGEVGRVMSPVRQTYSYRRVSTARQNTQLTGYILEAGGVDNLKNTVS